MFTLMLCNHPIFRNVAYLLSAPVVNVTRFGGGGGGVLCFYTAGGMNIKTFITLLSPLA